MENISRYVQALQATGASELLLTTGHAPLYRGERGLLPLPGAAPLADAALREQLVSWIGAELWERFVQRGSLSFAVDHDSGPRLAGTCMETLQGLAVTLRVLPDSPPTCEALALPSAAARLADHSAGLVAIAGPVRSGKSAVMAALVAAALAKRGGHAVIIEQRVQFVHAPGRGLVSHRQVGTHCESFAHGIANAARSDCDVIAVDRLDDDGALEAALEAAEGGALVLGAVQARHAARAIEHLRASVPSERRARAAERLERALRGVIAPRVLPRRGGGRTAVYEVWLPAGLTGGQTLTDALEVAVKRGAIDAADAKLA